MATDEPIYTEGSTSQTKVVIETAQLLGIVVIGRTASKIRSEVRTLKLW